MEAYVNLWVIKSLHLPDCPKRSYQLAKGGLIFDNKLTSFQTPDDEIKLKLFIQNVFKQKEQLHNLDTCAIRFFEIDEIHAVCLITTLCKKTGELVKAKHFNHEDISFKVTIQPQASYLKETNKNSGDLYD